MKTLLSAYVDRYGGLLDDILTGKVQELPAPGPGFAFFAAALYHRAKSTNRKRSVLAVAPGNADAEALAAEAELFLPADDLLYLPGYEGIPYEFSGLSSDLGLQRIRALLRIAAGRPALVFASTDAILRKAPPPARLLAQHLDLELQMELPPDRLARRLAALGYRREERVEAPGEFCLKGSVLDLFPVDADRPLRLEYFDDLIETIRRFDPITQAGAEKLESAQVAPAGEIVLNEAESAALRTLLRQSGEFQGREAPRWVEAQGSEEAISQLHHPGIEDLYPLVMECASVLESFTERPLIIHFPEDRVAESAERIWREFQSLYEETRELRCIAPPQSLLLPASDALAGACRAAALSSAPAASDANEIEPGSFAAAPSSVHGLSSSDGFRGRIGQVRGALSELARGGAQVLIASPYAAQMRRIAGLFRGEEGLDIHLAENLAQLELSAGGGAIQVVRSAQRQGFQCPAINLYLFTDAEIFGRAHRRRSRFQKLGSSPIDSFLDLKEGDFVVHITHGVGRFVELEKMRAAGRERDFLVLEYAEKDRLYVPLDQISTVQRYIAPTDNPRLDHLGKASFKKIRERVEQKIEEFAQELVRLYAVRMARKGFSFPADTAWQEEFEAEFPFEETPDQMQAIESVKRDMEASQPMDRLVCGDVGYGKTEVAIRAAFKAVMSGKQALVICPTTILAMQHHRNFRERFKNYPISIDWISRFRSRGEINEVKRRLAAGELDVVIGTHGLLSRDIRPRNLGLLMIDEEQRFGVSHKESIKRLRNLVDVLALSATPIPRTLHMSLVGIRDLSVIATPPQDRLPVQTFVLEENDLIVREAIAREMAREGQIFFLHNRIDSIQAAADRLLELVPDARVAVMHGQMLEEEIEDILLRFVERRFDVLVTTAIIENGIDMPNVNTLIVDRADTFGLSQLYQIRGRVGRAGRQAYAYFLYQAGRALTEMAQKRLNTLLEYQDLGSGFKVAMRDLEIRGAGNILGKEQSGNIMDVGYELYVKLLEDAVHRLKGEEIEAEVRTSVNLNTDFYLPAEYIPDTRQRIEFYKRFEAARDADEVAAIDAEMQDRFGAAPPAAQVFVKVEAIRTLSSAIGFESVYQTEDGRIQMKAGDHFRIKPEQLIHSLARTAGMSLNPAQPNTLYFQPAGEMLDSLHSALQSLLAPVSNPPPPSTAIARESKQATPAKRRTGASGARRP
ncbi:MAG: transcription-repair coupling factor [Leptospirales bacterium]|nr:transcription-repair coupling factor [Leptospirales bacterium]